MSIDPNNQWGEGAPYPLAEPITAQEQPAQCMHFPRCGCSGDGALRFNQFARAIMALMR